MHSYTVVTIIWTAQVVELIILRDKETRASKGSAFVWFATKQSADLAVYHLHNAPLGDPHNPNAQRLVVRRANGRKVQPLTHYGLSNPAPLPQPDGGHNNLGLGMLHMFNTTDAGGFTSDNAGMFDNELNISNGLEMLGPMSVGEPGLGWGQNKMFSGVQTSGVNYAGPDTPPASLQDANMSGHFPWLSKCQSADAVLHHGLMLGGNDENSVGGNFNATAAGIGVRATGCVPGVPRSLSEMSSVAAMMVRSPCSMMSVVVLWWLQAVMYEALSRDDVNCSLTHNPHVCWSCY